MATLAEENEGGTRHPFFKKTPLPLEKHPSRFFTSNIGSTEAMRMGHSVFATIERTVLCKVDQTLRPELVGRITDKVVFQRLAYGKQREICERMIQSEAERLKSLGHEVSISPALVEEMIREGYHRTLGARPMRNTVERRLQEMVWTRSLN